MSIKGALQEGVQQGEVNVIRRVVKARFGTMPAWAKQRLADLSPAELEDLSARVLKANTVEDLFW